MTGPHETDTTLASLYSTIAQQQRIIKTSRERLSLGYVRNSVNRTAHMEGKIQAAEAAIAELEARAAPLEALYDANPWTRYIVVPNGWAHPEWTLDRLWQGAIGWWPDYSAKTQTEVAVLAEQPEYRFAHINAPRLIGISPNHENTGTTRWWFVGPERANESWDQTDWTPATTNPRTLH